MHGHTHRHQHTHTHTHVHTPTRPLTHMSTHPHTPTQVYGAYASRRFLVPSIAHTSPHTHTGFRRVLLSSALGTFQKGTYEQSLVGLCFAVSSVALFVHCRQYSSDELNLNGELCQWLTAMIFLYALVQRLDENADIHDEYGFDVALTGMFPFAILVFFLFLLRRYIKCVFDLCCGWCKITRRKSKWERDSPSCSC